MVADNRTAHRAILDAERALAVTEGEIENQGMRRSAEAHVDNARRQFDRAQRILDRARDVDGRRADLHRESRKGNAAELGRHRQRRTVRCRRAG